MQEISTGRNADMVPYRAVLRGKAKALIPVLVQVVDGSSTDSIHAGIYFLT